jgi:hypothetical protein
VRYDLRRMGGGATRAVGRFPGRRRPRNLGLVAELKKTL